MNVDEAFKLIGIGRFNVIMYLILCLNFMFVPMHIFGGFFNTRIPPHHCIGTHIEESDSEQYCSHSEESNSDIANYFVPRLKKDSKDVHFDEQRTCFLLAVDSEEENKTVGCIFGHWFDTSSTGNTIVSEWELICENNSEVIFITVDGIAAILGAVIFAPFSDKYGRKATLLICWSQMALMSVGLYFIGDSSSYIILRFLERLYVEGAEQAIFILACEMLPTHLRANAVSIIFIFYGFGYMVLSLMAHLSTNWRYIQLAIAIGSLILLPINFYLPESPYWLVFMGREKSAEKFFREAVRHNKRKLPSDFKLTREVVEDDGNNSKEYHRSNSHLGSKNISTIDNKFDAPISNKHDESRHTVHPHVGHFKELYECLQNKMLRKEAGIASFTWALASFLCFGITVSGFDPGEDASIGILISGSAAVAASIVTKFSLQRFGRKKPIAAFCFLSSFAVILKSTLPFKINGIKLKTLHKVLKFSIKLFTTVVSMSIHLIVAELFPTAVRSTCVGFVAFFGLLGAGCGLYFNILERITYKGSTIGVGVLIFIAGYLCRGLPDTSNRPLPGTIVDLMELYAGVMEAIMRAMAKLPVSSDGGSKKGSRMSSFKIFRDSGRKRRKSSASVLNIASILEQGRRSSIPANLSIIEKLKQDRRFSFDTNVLARMTDNRIKEENLKNSMNNKYNINYGFVNEEDLVTKF